MGLYHLPRCLRCISTKSTFFHNYSHLMIGHIRLDSLSVTRQRLNLINSFNRCASSSVVKPLFLSVLKGGYNDRTAILDNLGSHTYGELVRFSTALAQLILAVTPRDPALRRRGSGVILNGERVAILCPNNITFAISQFAVWMSGCTAVPLCKVNPLAELDYVVRDSQSSVLIATREFADKAHSLAETNNLKLLILNQDAFSKKDSNHSKALDESSVLTTLQSIVEVPNCNVSEQDLIEKRVLMQKWSQVRWKNRKAMIVYTSGTTGPPKGVVQTFASLEAQVSMMLLAWGWTANDVILHVLPLHHVHGLVNVLACPLWCGATCVMMPEFNVEKVWDKLLEDAEPRVNLFMAVPTIYAKLIEGFESRFKGHKVRAFIKAKLRDRIRLMVVGSAALPQPVLEKWESISGHRLLERYGMTELGMALSNPLNSTRVPGAVGNPLPTVQVRIVDRNGNILVRGNSLCSEVTPGSKVVEGDLQVTGPAVTREYWNKPEATADSFTKDGWFKTGDTASFKDGVYRILGRTSVDIIKSGGYKISALDVERHLLAHNNMAECAVVGAPDVTWGQRVAAIVVLRNGGHLTLSELRMWARDFMAPYMIPTELRVVDAIPRNAMGKINKKQLLKDIFDVE